MIILLCARFLLVVASFFKPSSILLRLSNFITSISLPLHLPMSGNHHLSLDYPLLVYMPQYLSTINNTIFSYIYLHREANKAPLSSFLVHQDYLLPLAWLLETLLDHNHILFTFIFDLCLSFFLLPQTLLIARLFIHMHPFELIRLILG